jgi:hypothetical protein
MINGINPAILIPVYKNKLNHYEAISLARAIECFRNYPIIIFGPQKLEPFEINSYLNNKFFVDEIEYKYWSLPNDFFASVNAYNALMLSADFYSQLNHFSHILIYQLDCFVFKDQLLKWCRTEYDYIGAPIYKNGKPYGSENIQCIGAGGFSLRKVNSFLNILNSNRKIFNFNDLLKLLPPYNWKGKIPKFLRGLSVILSQNNYCETKHNSLLRVGINEDVVYGRYCNKYFDDFRVPQYQDAIKFCIDRYVTEELNYLQGNLPFGTHAWWTIEENFYTWKPFIEKYGYQVNNN